MKTLFNISIATLLLLSAACNDNGNSAKNAGSEVFKTQTEALEKAKQVDQVLQDDAQQQREKIDSQTQ
jgi:hypothetical protein